ncbi:MAG: bacterial transcriptional activator domain-containing protein [Eubacteriales bacterium]|nr:bacterial transcriptional activator domain-containing protein [Eubacteriales bacterium]
MKGDMVMNIEKPVLKVQLLGGMSLMYGDKPISFSRNTTTKAMKLLQILLYFGERGISRGKLIENLYRAEELADAPNSLRVTAYCLKKMLVTMGMPEHNYIRISKGTYYWNAPMETQVDVHRFKQLIQEAEQETEEEKRIGLIREACALYRGELLPGSSEDEWVVIESVQCKKKYSEALSSLCEYLWEKREYEEILSLCETACTMYPFDEWQTIRIDCFMALNRYRDAMKEYEETAKLFFEELGISPSEKLINQFKFMSERMKGTAQNIGDIKGRLREDEDEDGAFYVTLPSFRDGYRLVRRIMERNGQSVYLMLCSLVDSKGAPMEDQVKLSVMSDELMSSIKYCLRRGDSFTRYNPSQFLILLVGTNKENCGFIFDRIERYFCREHKSWKKYLNFYVTSIADADMDNARMVFQKNGIQWEG